MDQRPESPGKRHASWSAGAWPMSWGSRRCNPLHMDKLSGREPAQRGLKETLHNIIRPLGLQKMPMPAPLVQLALEQPGKPFQSTLTLKITGLWDCRGT